MTTNRSGLSDEKTSIEPVDSFPPYERLKSLIERQVKDAEANVAYAERQYHRAKQELATVKASHARICTEDAGKTIKEG